MKNKGNFHFISFEEVLISLEFWAAKIGSYNQHNKPIFIKNINYWKVNILNRFRYKHF